MVVQKEIQGMECKISVCNTCIAQIQVDGLAQVQVHVLKYLRTNTRVESASVLHKHNTTVHAMSSNRQAESFTS